MTKRIVPLLIVVLSLSFSTFAQRSNVSAAAEPAFCSQSIVDQANIFTGTGDIQALNYAIFNNEKVGGLIFKVLTVPDYGDKKSLSDFLHSVTLQCPNWQAPDNHNNYQSNLVIFGMSLNPPEITIEYGSAWKGILDQAVARITSIPMGGFMTSKGYASAMVSGINTLASIIQQEIDEPGAWQPFQNPIAVQTPVTPSPPADASWNRWQLVVFVLGGIAFLVVLFLKNNSKRKSAQ